MKKLKKRLKGSAFLFAFPLSLAIIACNPSQRAIGELKDLVEEVKENGDEFSSEDWESITTSYEDVMEKISEQDLTREQEKEVGHLNAQFLKHAGKHYSKYLMEEAKQIGNSVGNFMEGFMQGLNDSEDD